MMLRCRQHPDELQMLLTSTGCRVQRTQCLEDSADTQQSEHSEKYAVLKEGVAHMSDQPILADPLLQSHMIYT